MVQYKDDSPSCYPNSFFHCYQSQQSSTLQFKQWHFRRRGPTERVPY